MTRSVAGQYQAQSECATPGAAVKIIAGYSILNTQFCIFEAWIKLIFTAHCCSLLDTGRGPTNCKEGRDAGLVLQCQHNAAGGLTWCWCVGPLTSPRYCSQSYFLSQSLSQAAWRYQPPPTTDTFQQQHSRIDCSTLSNKSSDLLTFT